MPYLININRFVRSLTQLNSHVFMSDEKINVDIWHPARINALNFNFSWLGWHKWTKTKGRVVIWKLLCDVWVRVKDSLHDCCVFVSLSSIAMQCTLINDTTTRKRHETIAFAEVHARWNELKGNEWWMNSEECHTYINCFLALLLIRRILFASVYLVENMYLKATKCIARHSIRKEEKIDWRKCPARKLFTP